MLAPGPSFSINWLYVTACVIMAGVGLGYISFSLTTRVYIEWAHELPLSGGFSWPSVLTIDFFCFVTFLALLWNTWCDAQTEFGIEELSKPRFLRPRLRVKWTEVSDLKFFSGVGLHLYGKFGKIVVSPYAYSAPRRVIEFVTERAGCRGRTQ